LISGAGANIEQLNIVRRQLSLIKGGGLARACHAGQLITLLISDVLGDRPDIIASGPTVAGEATAADALQILSELKLNTEKSLAGITQYLQARALEKADAKSARSLRTSSPIVLGNNATAVDGAGAEAERLGYSHAMISATQAEGAAEDVGRHLASMAIKMRDSLGPDCLISGGEPTVSLVDETRRGKGGRNQQLALAALTALGDGEQICLLSGGTDGEDGPTDAAGAFVTADIVYRARESSLDPGDFLARNDAYSFFQQAGGLFITGPTQTNVCDLRVVVTA
jgi:glycerate-2-kinase